MPGQSPFAPRNLAEYTARATINCRVEGYGADVVTVVACPFCAAGGFWRLPIVNVRGPMEKETTCGECHRKARALFKVSRGSIEFEVVQTGGDDPPDWLEAAPRRV